MALKIGHKMQLPKGTPREYPPFPGATKNWSVRSRIQVARIKAKAPGIVCATYASHGRTGEPWGIDIMVSPFHNLFNNEQKQFGWDLCNWIVRHWDEFHLNYVIYDNLMNEINGNGWFSYEPYRKDWGGGSQQLVTSRHRDHIHLQIDNPHVAGNE